MPSARLDDVKIVRREEKQERLIAFIAQALRAHEDDATTGPATIDVVVRSLESPVAHAVAQALSEAYAQAIIDSADTLSLRARVIVANTEADGVGAADLSSADVRYATSSGLEDAHEQMVIADRAIWIGDCMRRDPIKLDAFERYVADDDEPVQWAALAFNRLWDISEAPRANAGHGRLADLEGFDLASLAANATVFSATHGETNTH
ncbi:MAG: hypothetical protein AAFR55_06350 [Pseudomonadota bacterium]